MWIDALCINQTDDVEKSEQVKQMQFIYARTSHLVLWVGEASEDSDLGMQICKLVGPELEEVNYWDVDLGHLALNKDAPTGIEAFHPKPWVTVNRLFHRDWFEWVWVLPHLFIGEIEAH